MKPPRLNYYLICIWTYMFLLPVPMMCLWVRAQSCPTLCDPMDYSPPGCSVYGISQAWILEWVATASSREFSCLRYRTCVSWVSCIGRRILYHWATWENQTFQLKLKFDICICYPFSIHLRGACSETLVKFNPWITSNPSHITSCHVVTDGIKGWKACILKKAGILNFLPQCVPKNHIVKWITFSHRSNPIIGGYVSDQGVGARQGHNTVTMAYIRKDIIILNLYS